MFSHGPPVMTGPFRPREARAQVNTAGCMQWGVEDSLTWVVALFFFSVPCPPRVYGCSMSMATSFILRPTKNRRPGTWTFRKHRFCQRCTQLAGLRLTGLLGSPLAAHSVFGAMGQGQGVSLCWGGVPTRT